MMDTFVVRIRMRLLFTFLFHIVLSLVFGVSQWELRPDQGVREVLDRAQCYIMLFS